MLKIRVPEELLRVLSEGRELQRQVQLPKLQESCLNIGNRMMFA